MARGKEAYGFCDRTGFRYPLSDLVQQIENGKPNGQRVGRDMRDIDHEQWKIGEINIAEDISLHDPRPDRGQTESRAMTAWSPVGGGVTAFGSRTVGLDIVFKAGQVTVGGS